MSVEAAVARLNEIVGGEHVLTSESDRASRSRDISLWQRTCAAVVYPGTAEEVSEVVKVAAQFGLPIWPFSKGKNWGYGATQGLREGALIVMLERLNRILDVNEELAYAVIEPGVTQRQLNDHLKRNGIRLWVDCTDSTPEGSVVGNALERGIGYTPYWDHFANLCGLEVVLPDGEIVRTGGGPANSHSWNTFKWGTGPYLEGLFTQSNLGIVTKAGVWLMPEPEAFAAFICEIDDEGRLPAAMDAIRRLALHRAIPANVHVVNDMLLLAQMIQYPYDLLAGRTHLGDEMRAALRARYRIAPWTVTGGLYGTKGQVLLAKRAVRKALGSYGRVRFIGGVMVGVIRGVIRAWKLLRAVPGITPALTRLMGSSLQKLEVIPHVYPILKGVPGEYIVGFAYFKTRGKRPRKDVDPVRDGAGMTWMAVITPMTGRHTKALLELVQPLFERHGLDLSLTFMMVNARSAVGLFEIFFDRESQDERSRMLALYDELAEATARAGYQQYRTSVAYFDRVLGPSPSFQRLAETLKAAVDPNGILAPGRYGVGLRSP
jgi:4-cresol dehydrogenase (hydroxylating)